MRLRRFAGASALTLLLAACGGGQIASYTSATPPSDQAPEGMGGRWMLSAPNAPSCGVTFNSAAGARSGRISPDGGCPARFFMARNWRLDGQTLTINDPDDAALATLTMANGRFEGTSATGMPLSLARPVVAAQ